MLRRVFKAGDKVRFLDAAQSGLVVKVISSFKIEVEIEKGFTVIVSEKELVRDYSSSDDFSKNITTHPLYLQKTKPVKKKIDSIAVDLHYTPPKGKNEILPIFKLNNSEIIDIQLNKLSTALAKALAEGARALIVIHGVGQGTLKAKVHEFLKSNRHVRAIEEADRKRYGTGASRIVLA